LPRKMKPKLTILLLLGLAATAHPQSPAGSTSRSPVIVELFTSEGCSTCPPADSLLKNLESSQPVQGAEIIALEEHVDYWNHEGWVDPFSSREWTSRQEEYASRFKVADIYTPEMVVDGKTELLGSDAGKAQAAIADAARAGETPVSVSAQPSPAKEAQRFNVRVGKLIGSAPGDAAEVWLAVSEGGLQSSVTAGENAGRHLTHAGVLRSLRKIGDIKSDGSQSFEATPEVKLKPDWKRDNLQVVVFVQERKSRKILGSAATHVTG
jgi:hypothetical protein